MWGQLTSFASSPAPAPAPGQDPVPNSPEYCTGCNDLMKAYSELQDEYSELQDEFHKIKKTLLVLY